MFPSQTLSEPVRLRIPAIGVDAAVQTVGVDDGGNMSPPSNYTDVAWFGPGPRPGAIGNAVINGHLDSKTGPAVFYDLDRLQPGDEIFVVTASGAELRFIVSESASYATADAPLSRIFGPATSANLNLITCAGSFDQSSRRYDQRLVVYARLAAAAP